MQAWQTAWEQFSQQAAEPVKAREVQQARIRQFEPHMAQLREREQRLRTEGQYIASELAKAGVDMLREQAAERDRQCESQEQRLEQIEAQMREVRAQEETVAAQLKDLRGRQQSGEARLASLRELQAAALGQHDAGLNEWLKNRQLNDAPRLAGMLSVEAGWERAVERVLGAELGAVCVSNLDTVAASLADLKKSELVMFDLSAPRGAMAPAHRTTLLEKVSSQADLGSLLAGVYIAEHLDEALAVRTDLAPHESVVTRDGIWLGRNWVAVANEESVRAGIIGRNREIESLSAELAQVAQATALAQTELNETQAQQQHLDAERAEARRQLNELQRERTTLHGQLGREESKLGQLSSRHQQIETELGELTELLHRDEEQLQAARQLLQEAEAQGAQHEQTRRQLHEQRDRLRGALEAARAAASAANDALHQLDMERQAQQTAFDSTQQSIARLEGQLKHLTTRRAELEQILATHEDPGAELQQRLEEFLQKRLVAEERLSEARAALTALDTALREQEQARGQQERQVQQVRQALEQERMARQEQIVRRQTLDEQIREAGFEAGTVLNDVPAEMTEEACQAELDQVLARVDRLGPINLVAIQEYEEQSQRKAFLDQQSEDLSQALATLEDAMRKMDRETRTRFKETFDKVNTGFQAFFPRLFGGGHAYLELVGDDLLDTGVSVMARPPGKRNSTIHLLSGGEKALTAVSLLFAIFELNPAPFCLLDEVDAPLDDANVERYAQTLKTMSVHTQLMYITHNKISMEIADVLLGVTMSEPGVSRLVAVDVDQAMEMVAQ
jgi:chromosome segregation protein